jgi:hypothetical protein
MAQEAVAQRPARSRVGIEVTHGTTPTMTDFFPIEKTVDLSGLEQEQLPVETETARAYDEKDHVDGFKKASVPCSIHIRPDGTQLSGPAVAPVVHWLGILWRACWGNDDGSVTSNPNYAPAAAAAGNGTLVVASPAPTTTSFSVTPAQGALITVGQMMLMEIGSPGSGVLEPIYIKSRATDAFTTAFAMSAPPQTGAHVYGMYTYGISQSSVAGLCFEHAKSLGANEQWRVNAGTVAISDLKLERGKLPTAKVTIKGATWQQLSALGIPVTTGTDTMAGATACRDAIILLQLTTDTTRVHYPMESVTFEWNDDLILLPDYQGIEGTTQLFRNPTKQFARAKVRMRTDLARVANWTARDKLMLFVMIPTGTGLTKRWVVFAMPTCVIFGNPKHVMADYSVSEFTLHSKQGALTTGVTTDLALTPILMAHG